MAHDFQIQFESIYRSEAGKILASLVGVTRDISAAEDLLQDAVARAMSDWQENGFPPNPGGWLLVTARNRAVDQFRRNKKMADKSAMFESLERARFQAEDMDTLGGFPDERLRLIFTCCHPVLASEARVALTLRTVCGLSTQQIAHAFLVEVPTMAQRLVRAKRLKDEGVGYEIPAASELPDRIDSVLDVIYLVFNEGYHSTSGDRLFDGDLCKEALRLGHLLDAAIDDEPEVTGLLALMLLHDARRPSRVDADGALVLLEDQDRSLYDAAQIQRGSELVEHALTQGRVGPFQIQAAVAALHAQAKTPSETDWRQIVALYTMLLRIAPSAVVALNRAAAIAMAFGPEEGLTAVAEIEASGELANYALLPATRADLHRRLGQQEAAIAAYEAAIELTENVQETDYYRGRIAELA